MMKKVCLFPKDCLAAGAVEEVELLQVQVIHVLLLLLILINIVLFIGILLVKDNFSVRLLLPLGGFFQCLNTVVLNHQSNESPERIVTHQLLLLHPHEEINIFLQVVVASLREPPFEFVPEPFDTIGV